jgi:type III secretory pathway component EscR
MIKNRKYFISFIIGAMAMLLLFFIWQKITGKSGDQVQNDYYIITNQIRKMNKLVVMEQDFSSMQKTKISSQLAGGFLPASEKEIITFTKTNAQVSYDLNKMKIDVDSIGKKLVIQELPNADIKITPSVEIQSFDDSFFNRFDENDIKKITNSAKENAFKTVNQNRLRSEGRKQLMVDLNQIFVLAKALHYKIEDKTGTLDSSKL